MSSTLISSGMRRFLSASFVTLLVLLTCPQGFGSERIFGEKNFAITPPDGWEQVKVTPPKPSLIATYQNSDNTAMFQITMHEGETIPRPMTDKWIADFERGIESTGAAKCLSGHFIDVMGIRAYERTGRFQLGGKDMSSVLRLIPGDGMAYQLQAISFDGDADKNPELRKALESFRYLSVPAETNSETAALEGSAAYRMGGLVAKGLIGIVVLLVIGKMFSK